MEPEVTGNKSVLKTEDDIRKFMKKNVRVTLVNGSYCDGIFYTADIVKKNVLCLSKGKYFDRDGKRLEKGNQKVTVSSSAEGYVIVDLSVTSSIEVIPEIPDIPDVPKDPEAAAFEFHGKDSKKPRQPHAKSSPGGPSTVAGSRGSDTFCLTLPEELNESDVIERPFDSSGETVEVPHQWSFFSEEDTGKPFTSHRNYNGNNNRGRGGYRGGQRGRGGHRGGYRGRGGYGKDKESWDRGRNAHRSADDTSSDNN